MKHWIYGSTDLAIDERANVYNGSLVKIRTYLDNQGHLKADFMGKRYYVLDLVLDHFFPKLHADEYPEFKDGNKANCRADNIVIRKQNRINKQANDDHYKSWLRAFYKNDQELYMKVAKMSVLDKKIIDGSVDLKTEKLREAENSIPKLPEEPETTPIAKPSFYTVESLRKNHPQSLSKKDFDNLLADVINSGVTGPEALQMFTEAEITRSGKAPHSLHLAGIKKQGLIE